jgi:hypothetical protein
MTDKTTISARLDRSHIEILDKVQGESGLSRTDVIQLALDYLSNSKVAPRPSSVEIPISSATMRRASRLHITYGYGTTLIMLLSEAVDIGVREIRSRVDTDRREDLQLARNDMDANAVEMEQDSISS